ncbi:MAG: DNA polymerase III subunit delta [Candidatus Omnitrophica bacterium]|nr:DNA polymerase III subunit delta [Candidatus Omnitrophota bacterium]
MVTPQVSVFLFIGDDKYLKEEALKDLRSSLQGKSQYQYDQITFYGGELEAGEVFSQLNTVPLLSDKRLIVIKDIEKAPDEFRNSLIDYIKKPSKSAYLILEAKNDSVLKDYDEAIKRISVRYLGMPTGSMLISWMKSYVGEKGKTIDNGASAILKELEGNDLSYLSQELDKLVTFIGSRKEISSDDVEELVGKSLVISAFDITDAIGRRNITDAIKISSNLTSNGKKEYEIIGILSWHLKRMLKAKTLKERGENDYTIASILRIGRRFQDEFFRQLAGFNMGKIRSNIELLLRADLDIKRSKFSPGTVLELALIRLCLL